jgi:hypothetical protein
MRCSVHVTSLHQSVLSFYAQDVSPAQRAIFEDSD